MNIPFFKWEISASLVRFSLPYSSLYACWSYGLYDAALQRVSDAQYYLKIAWVRYSTLCASLPCASLACLDIFLLILHTLYSCTYEFADMEIFEVVVYAVMSHQLILFQLSMIHCLLKGIFINFRYMRVEIICFIYDNIVTWIVLRLYPRSICL